MYPNSEPDIAERHRHLLDAIRSKELARCSEAIRSHIERKLADIPD